MAAIAKVDVDLKELYTEQQKLLPSYARPIFLRLLEKVDLTGELVTGSSLLKFRTIL